MSAVGPEPASPHSLDIRRVTVYLNDHLAGSMAAPHRFERVARALRRTPLGATVAGIAEEVTDERRELRDLIQALDGAGQNPVKQAIAWLGGRVAQMRAARGGLESPTDTLLAVEVLRGALVGKMGVWQTLQDLAPGLDAVRPARVAELLEQTERQIRQMDEVHAYVRVRAVAARGERESG